MGRRSAAARLESTAHHEAGHAVAAWVLGATLKDISIVLDGEGNLGTTRDDNLHNLVRDIDVLSIDPDEGSLDRVSVILDGDHLVRCPVRPPPSPAPVAEDPSTWNPELGTWQDVERECITRFAGVVAQRRFTGGRYHWAGACGDLDGVRLLLYQVCRVDDDAYRAYTRLHRRRAEHLVATWWPVVARVAAELLVRAEMTGFEATEVMLAAEQVMLVSRSGA